MTSTALPITYETEAERLQLYRAVRADMLKSMPTEAELPLWLLDVLGIWLPHRQICDGHTTPFRYFADRYYERELDTILWASRMWGKSLTAGLECWMKGRDPRRPYWRANICAASQSQARNVYDATDLFWTRTDDIGGRAVLKRDPLKSSTEYLDGSKYELTTSSETAQRGLHPNTLIADELDQIPFDTFRAALNQTREGYGHKPSTALISTMHKVGGLFSDWVDHAEIRGYKLYISCILETLEACTDDYDCEKCNLDQYCERRLKAITQEEEKIQIEAGIIKVGMKPHMGFNTIETVRQKVRQGYEKEEKTGHIRAVDVDAELFSKRPSRTGLVFPDFNENFHVVPAQEINIQTEWHKGRTTDFGHRAPFVDLYFAITPRDQIIFYYEFVRPGMTMPDIISHLAEGRKHTRFLKTFGDPAGATEIATIKQAGILIEPVVREIHEGITAINHLLRQNIDGKPQFIISSACPVFIDEIKKLPYPENNMSEKPVKKDDHCVEAASRAVVAWMRGWLQPLDSILKDVKTGGQSRGRETSTDRAYRETKTAIRKVKRGRNQGLNEGRESIRRVADFNR